MTMNQIMGQSLGNVAVVLLTVCILITVVVVTAIGTKVIYELIDKFSDLTCEAIKWCIRHINKKLN